MLDILGPVLLTLAAAHLSAVLGLVVHPGARLPAVGAVILVGASTGVLLAFQILPGQSLVAAVAAGSFLALAAGTYSWMRPALRSFGAALWVTWLAFGVTASVWSLLFLATLDLSLPTRVLLWAAVAVAMITLPSALLTAREGWEALLRRAWARPREPLLQPPTRLPRVSLHVPTHAEPPSVVIATLDRLAALDHPDFEVLVIDNNTSDESLWRPVQQHCEVLGPRFRFLHVEGLTGAKAGALNWALPHSDPTAELIGVVDADYQVEPSWLRETVGYYEDPDLGFVQAPHAYRDYAHSTFGRWANAEYSVFFTTGMVALNEHNAGLTVGTMSLLRREALETAGGWAEWCLTEDSELAIRIHAAGYDSVYLTEPYGRGLIPETFSAYRKQRFRWTYGPVQELQHHWRLFLPRWLGGTPSGLTAGQRLHHANHGIDVLCIGLRLLALLLGVLAGASMLLHGERVPLPVELWAASTALLLSSLTIRALVYCRIVGATVREALGGTVAFASLALVISIASLRATLGRPAAWQRTEKFQTQRSGGLGALRQAALETALAVVSLAAAVAMIIGSSGGVITMLAIGLIGQALTYATSPLLALTANGALRHGVQAGPVLERRRTAAEDLATTGS